MPDLPYLILPLWVLLFGFIASLFFWKYWKVQQALGLIFSALYLLAAGLLLVAVYQNDMLVLQIGNWPAPYGITLVADLFSAMLVLISAIITLAIVLYSIQDVSQSRKKKGFYPLLLIMLCGVCGSFLTGDIFNLYVWFEVMLVASFVLIVLGNDKAQLEGAVKYVILSFISSGFLLMGIGILYRLTGTLNMADLAMKIPSHPNQSGMTISAVFFFMGFGIKAALFPLFSWLPASYPTPPISVSALMAGLLTKVGVYAFIRFFTLLFVHNTALTHGFLLIVAGLTMFFGVLGAVAQNDFKKVLSFHIVSQIGYMIMGLALFTKWAIAGAIFYMAHHIIVKSNLFLISGIVKHINGHSLLIRLGGLYRHFPFVTLLFTISAFSLAGIPPLSGFWGKFILAKSGLESEQYFIVFVSLMVGLLTLFSMTKIWKHAFWSNTPEGEDMQLTQPQLFKNKYMLLVASLFLTVCTLWLSLYPDLALMLSQKASEQLLDPQVYIKKALNQ
ncbi:MAG: proton-conducting transporter membrane subunit [Marinoscillum sp.]